MRLDIFLVNQGYYRSREQAKEAIANSLVEINGKIINKASYQVLDSDIIHANQVCRYVSRGGIKLEKAIEEFFLDFSNKTIVDIGSSTGGFTDCALQFGAKKVYSIDVGTDQLDQMLYDDDRVVSLEQTNFLDISTFDEKIDFYIMDVSFISIKQIIPHIRELNGKNIVALIKPQFEVGPKFLNKNGVLKDRAMHYNVLKDIYQFVLKNGLKIHKLAPSPIKGKSGNIEYLTYIKESSNSNIDLYEIVSEAFSKEE